MSSRNLPPIAGGSGEPPHRSLEVVALLRSHGLGARTARLVAREGEALRQQMESAHVELAALFDAVTNQRLGEVLHGQDDQVHVGAHIQLLRPGGWYVQLHTHPASGSFSDVDLTLLLDNPSIRTMVVVGQDRTWYFVSKLRGQPTADPEDAYDAWGAIFEALYPRYQAAVELGGLGEPAALRAMTHEILTTLAPTLRLRYDRLECG